MVLKTSYFKIVDIDWLPNLYFDAKIRFINDRRSCYVVLPDYRAKLWPISGGGLFTSYCKETNHHSVIPAYHGLRQRSLDRMQMT